MNEKQTSRPRENARKSKYHISDGMKKILKKANILCPSALANGHDGKEPGIFIWRIKRRQTTRPRTNVF